MTTWHEIKPTNQPFDRIQYKFRLIPAKGRGSVYLPLGEKSQPKKQPKEITGLVGKETRNAAETIETTTTTIVINYPFACAFCAYLMN